MPAMAMKSATSVALIPGVFITLWMISISVCVIL